jgi:hypothetical protein
VDGLVGGGGGGGLAGAAHGYIVVGSLDSSKPNQRWRTHGDFWPKMENARL